MDDIALLRHASAEFERRLAAVTPDQLMQPTPCAEWEGRLSRSSGAAPHRFRGEGSRSASALTGNVPGARPPLLT
jgi:hypothetical protein